MDNINNNISSPAAHSGFRGSMKIAHELTGPADQVSLSVSQEMGFLGGIGSKIKDLFTGKSSSSPAAPAKEPGGWCSGPDGQSQWYPQSSPPPPKNPYGHWVLDTACGGASWFWAKNTEPAAGPVYGPAFKPGGIGSRAPGTPGTASELNP